MAMRRSENSLDIFKHTWRAKLPCTLAYSRVPTKCRMGNCGHYPSLEVVGSSAPSCGPLRQSTSDPPPLLLSRTQLQQHITRPGALGDHFDHPLLFLRSGVDLATLQTYRLEDTANISLGEAGSHSSSSSDGDLSTTDVDDGSTKDGSDLEAALRSSASMESLISITRSILSFTPRLVNLALSGFLSKAITGSRAPPGLPLLESLSLGPPPHYWTAAMRLDHSVFAGVRELRLADVDLGEQEVDSILALPQLQHLEWTPQDWFTAQRSEK